jgi:hypothetical protein
MELAEQVGSVGKASGLYLGMCPVRIKAWKHTILTEYSWLS